MIVSEIYETMAGDLYGVVLNEDIKIIRVVKINDRELTPDFFRRARMGFLTEHSYDQSPKEKMWRCIESNCRLVATITNCHGFIVHADHDMTRSSRKMFGKRARMNYDRRYNGGANYGGTIHSRANYCHKANQFA